MVPKYPFQSGPILNEIGNGLYYVGILLGTLIYGILFANFPFRFIGQTGNTHMLSDFEQGKSGLRSKAAYEEQVYINLTFLGLPDTLSYFVVAYIFPIANIIAYIALFEFIGWVFAPELLEAAGLLLLAAITEIVKYVIDFYNVFIVPSVNAYSRGYLKEITFQTAIYLPSTKLATVLVTGFAALTALVTFTFTQLFGRKKESEPVLIPYHVSQKGTVVSPDYTKPSAPIQIPGSDKHQRPPKLEEDDDEDESDSTKPQDSSHEHLRNH